MPPKKVKKNIVNQKQNGNYKANECDKIGEIALDYGFSVVISPHITSDDISKAKGLKSFDYYNDAEEKVSLVRFFDENKIGSETPPAMLHFKKPGKEVYGFEIMGSNRSTSEALLIKTALAILSDLGYKNLYIDVNSIGDRESISRFERELGSYFRKNAHELSAKARADFKKNPYSLILEHTNELESLEQTIPQTVGTLSDISREHFKEVLEYLEAFGVTYKIQPNLLSNKSFASGTVFEIREEGGKSSDKLLCYGYRYNYLAKKIGGKKDIPTVGMTIAVKKNPKFTKKINIEKLKKPSFYLIQLGSTAKLKALNIVEILRKNKIPVYHSLTKDKIGGQLMGADYTHASHLLIVGQKEAIDNTVVVRNTVNREQETVSVKDLPEFLKKLQKQK